MKENRHRRGVGERSPRLTGLGRAFFQALTEKIAPQVSRTIAALSILMSLAMALAVGPTIVGGPAPAHRTIDDISPNPGVLVLGGSTEATVSLTSELSCLEAESDPGIDVQFTPACGSGVWSSTMMVSDHGGVNNVTMKVVVKEVDIDDSEIDSEDWNFIFVVDGSTTTDEVSPTTTTPGTTTSPPQTTTSPPQTTTSPPQTTTTPPNSTSVTSPTSTSVPVSTTQPGGADSDEILDQLREAAIAFNTPDTLELDETVTIQLLLSLIVPSEELEEEITAPGATQGAEIPSTCSMTAQLDGTNFKVLPLTVLTQFVCVPGMTAEWRWEVTALKEGPQQLTLVLTAEIDDEPPSVVKTFEETIEIQVGLVKKVFGPIAENLSITLSAFLAALGAAVGTWSWKRFRRAGAKGESAD